MILLSQNLGIQNLPTLLFIPVQGKPQVVMGTLPKEELAKAIHDVLLVKITPDLILDLKLQDM